MKIERRLLSITEKIIKFFAECKGKFPTDFSVKGGKS